MGIAYPNCWRCTGWVIQFFTKIMLHQSKLRIWMWLMLSLRWHQQITLSKYQDTTRLSRAVRSVEAKRHRRLTANVVLYSHFQSFVISSYKNKQESSKHHWSRVRSYWLSRLINYMSIWQISVHDSELNTSFDVRLEKIEFQLSC